MKISVSSGTDWRSNKAPQSHHSFLRQTLLLILTAVLITVLAGCAGATPQPSDPQVTLTAEELSAFNGKDGQPAYIAVDGVIYDVTKVSFWKNGEHNGFAAGQDLTEEIKTKSPHGVSKLRGLPVVGTLMD